MPIIQEQSVQLPLPTEEYTDPTLIFEDVGLNNSNDEESEGDDLDDSLVAEFHQMLESCDSERDEYATLLSLFYGANLTQTAFSMVVQFLNLCGSNIPKKFDHLVDRFLDIKDKNCIHPSKDFTKVYHCKVCEKTLSLLAFPKQRQCSKCKTRLSMHYCFNIESQMKSLINRNVIKFNQASELSSDSTTISDVVDCKLYRDFLETSQGESVLNGNGFTLSLNTDGANPSNKSSISLWPVFLTVNEIPIEERYCIENVIVASNN